LVAGACPVERRFSVYFLVARLRKGTGHALYA
jgi:hypothetical protein